MSPRFQMNRRSAIAAAVSLVVTPLLPSASVAQTGWPSRPIKIIDMFQPGGSNDAIARMLAAKLAPRLGQPVTVENRPGAGGTVGVDAVAKSPPDGHTLLMTLTSAIVNSASGKKLPYDILQDLVPVGQVASSPLLIVVAADSPFKTLRDLVEAARGRPDAVRFASGGVGSISHIGMEMLAAQTNVKMLHVPYKGGVTAAMPDFLSGQVQASLGSIAGYLGLIQGGKMRAVAVTGPQRLPQVPDTPTSAEAGYPNYVIQSDYGLLAPAGTPADVIRRLNSELRAIVAEPETREFLERLAAVPKTGTPEEYGRLNAMELARWSKLIRESNIKVE